MGICSSWIQDPRDVEIAIQDNPYVLNCVLDQYKNRKCVKEFFKKNLRHWNVFLIVTLNYEKYEDFDDND